MGPLKADRTTAACTITPLLLRAFLDSFSKAGHEISRKVGSLLFTRAFQIYKEKIERTSVRLGGLHEEAESVIQPRMTCRQQGTREHVWFKFTANGANPGKIIATVDSKINRFLSSCFKIYSPSNIPAIDGLLSPLLLKNCCVRLESELSSSPMASLSRTKHSTQR
ncbi:hypothetical protein NC653_038970 [Populus alba x Populus x berolinensis]|uniref:Uncharacterized protein n=1 Tax=Populus alba x Populus x berolinensis TaxID=444605 RepID=A0AAD6PRJ4_9ROSI|nr:hypothetical protein NC653_038941 [Populus alba x Populus x berolinensis]KAJ6956912.1 hypothetical protein NC653_038970 [Populus alba x Populus x berolinensis]